MKAEFTKPNFANVKMLKFETGSENRRFSRCRDNFAPPPGSSHATRNADRN
jgi:hypothetical protein